MIKIAIAGCTGRMGQVLIRKILASKELSLAGGSALPGDLLIGSEVGTLVHQSTEGAYITSDTKQLFLEADVVVDFTAPAYSLELAAMNAQLGKAHVCGTTGFTDAQMQQFKSYVKSSRTVWSGNMSVGVNMLAGLVEQAASRLSAEDYDIEIDEMHHRHKVDAPSGTALLLGNAAAKGRKVDLSDVRVNARSGHTGARKAGSIGFSVRRGGDVVGDHSVIFAGDGDRIEITHKASSRDIFASGALRAAVWLNDKPNGFYSMRDVLGL